MSGRLTLGPQKDDNDTIKNISYDPTTAGSRGKSSSSELTLSYFFANQLYYKCGHCAYAMSYIID